MTTWVLELLRTTLGLLGMDAPVRTVGGGLPAPPCPAKMIKTTRPCRPQASLVLVTIMMVMLIMNTIKSMNVEYIWLTSLNTMRINISFAVAYDFNQLTYAVCSSPRRFRRFPRPVNFWPCPCPPRPVKKASLSITDDTLATTLGCSVGTTLF